MSEPDEMPRTKSAKIVVHGSAEPPSFEVLEGYPGKIVDVVVGGVVKVEGTPFFDLCRFARVLQVRRREPSPSTCPRCEMEAFAVLEVEWELEEATPPEKEICEQCILGVVTEGEDLIAFQD